MVENTPRVPFLVVCLACLSASAAPARADLVGGTIEISGPGCRFPDVAYGSAQEKYLVVWADYNVTRVSGRWVTGAGAAEGAPFEISEAPFGALFPAVAHNATDDEFLVTWDDFNGRGEVIHDQRVRASGGALAGKNFAIASMAGGIRSAVAWSPASNVYLVAYFVPGVSAEIYAQRVSGTGALLGSNFNVSTDGIFSGYPAVAWGEEGNQFLVTWDNNDGNIHGRRVDAATGNLLGPAIHVTSGGAKDRSAMAWDSVSKRWLVQYNDGSHAGFSYDQYGRFVTPDGSLSGDPVPLAHSAGFEGDTQFGGDIAFAPAAERFFSSFGTDTGMSGQESFSSGEPVGPPVVLGTGFYTSLNNAADTRRNRFFTAWEGLVGEYRILGRLHAATLGPPADFTAAAEDARNVLSWRNPTDPHCTGTMIRFKTTGYPSGPGDGELVADLPGEPGSMGGFIHSGLTNWTTYYYAAFAHDGGPNPSTAARAAATPREEPPTVIHATEFKGGADGWTLASWQSGTLSPGTIAWDPDGEDLLATGSGKSNNRDTCTREGASLTRAISTAGHRSVQIEYDAMAELHAPPGASAPGNCPVLEGGIEDKLALSISTAGTGGPWTVAHVLAEPLDLPAGWTRKLLNLAGVPGVDDNPSFAVRFQWQFNNERDSGRLDNIRVLSGAVTGAEPAIGLDRHQLERAVEAGSDLPGDYFLVGNSGEGVLDFTVSEDIPWLSVSPRSASSSGPPRRVAISYDTSGLSAGSHQGEIVVTSASASNSPQALAVRVQVLPPACLREPFSYYDGELTTMGSAGWSGDATSQIVVEGGALKIVGGSGAASATCSVACAGSEGIVAVHVKIRRGAGTGDYFWNIAIDDDSGNSAAGNLGRWYGGSSTARGRIGGEVTSDMALSSSGDWDELLMEIDTTADTSEFFLNGESHGILSHGSGPTDNVGAIRIERFDRVGADRHSIFFDDLAIESAALRVFHRGDADSSGTIGISDAIAVLSFLFRGGAAPGCAESADWDNDGSIDIADGLRVLFFLFAGGLPPVVPGPPGSPCGADPDAPGSEGDLGCGAYDRC